MASMVLRHLRSIFWIGRTINQIFGIRLLCEGRVGPRLFRLGPEEADVGIRPTITHFLHSDREVLAGAVGEKAHPLAPPLVVPEESVRRNCWLGVACELRRRKIICLFEPQVSQHLCIRRRVFPRKRADGVRAAPCTDQVVDRRDLLLCCCLLFLRGGSRTRRDKPTEDDHCDCNRQSQVSFHSDPPYPLRSSSVSKGPVRR